jgi:hypothetical protein
MTATIVSATTAPPPSLPPALNTLPDVAVGAKGCPRRPKMQIDLLLLALEALELGSAETFLATAKQLELDEILKNRLVLWRIRASNPLRRAHTRRQLSQLEAKTLVIVACQVARRSTVTIRQLLLAYQQLQVKQLPPEYNFRLSQYLDRFRSQFRSRMNPRRAFVSAYTSDDELNILALDLLHKLLFCTGTAGLQRLWIGLFDGEVN